MPSTYVPRGDLAARDWAVAFATHLSADPERFGRTPAEAMLVQGLVDDFAARLAVTTGPGMRTAVAVVAKTAARTAMLAAMRPIAQRIRTDGRIGDADKRALGLTLAPATHARVAVPSTAPLVRVSVVAPLVHAVRFADSSTPHRRAKPAGVDGLQVFTALTAERPGPSSPPTPDDAAYRAFVTRQGQTIAYPPSLNGRLAHYFCRWQNTRGEPGPWSAVTSLVIAG